MWGPVHTQMHPFRVHHPATTCLSPPESLPGWSPSRGCLALKDPVVCPGPGGRHHLPLQTDVGQCWIIFNAVLFPLDSSLSAMPPLLFFLPASSFPSPSDSLGNREADVSALFLFLAPVIVTAFSSAHFINSFCEGGLRGRRGWAGTGSGREGRLLQGPWPAASSGRTNWAGSRPGFPSLAVLEDA